MKKEKLLAYTHVLDAVLLAYTHVLDAVDAVRHLIRACRPIAESAIQNLGSRGRRVIARLLVA